MLKYLAQFIPFLKYKFLFYRKLNKIFLIFSLLYFICARKKLNKMKGTVTNSVKIQLVVKKTTIMLFQFYRFESLKKRVQCVFDNPFSEYTPIFCSDCNKDTLSQVIVQRHGTLKLNSKKCHQSVGKKTVIYFSKTQCSQYSNQKQITCKLKNSRTDQVRKIYFLNNFKAFTCILK